MNRQDSNIPWWLVVLGLLFVPALGILLLVLKLGGVRLGGSTSTTTTRTTAATKTTHFSPTGRQTTQAGQYDAPTETAQKQAQQKLWASLKKASGKNIYLGRLMAILSGVFSFGALMELMDQIGTYLSWGYFYFKEFSPTLGIFLAGLITLGLGVARTRLGGRQRLYLGAIGNRTSIFLSDLASAAGVSEKRVERDLQKMLSNGTLPMGYIDRASGRLVLTDQGYERPHEEPKQATSRVVQEATQEDKDRAILLQIRAINDSIPGAEMSRKIDRIEEITGKILAYARTHPKKSGELRQFLNYYLPTTLKILNAYAQMDAQGIEGENITAAKARIEGMMDKVVDGFEKQLDQLFRSDAMDITTDVEVLERMLQKDGLGSDDISLTLNPTGGYQNRPQTGSAAATQDAPE